ncbi:hypothetical protein FIBSPDRAFT_849586 [Athelia psychrophila]|uniref:Uncharacterized protein n=1 Tax=Athelia psychrophila TaxID=1759441 RepID=A0A166UEH5_9AGAM|nr:hypothetical protein FIBSPDRAFT_849586 [Fibularhizoctonia sp. CBS 109695]
MDAQSSTKPTTVQAQPQAATSMNSMKAPENHTECLNAKANRARGAGAGKDCLLGMIECFICFECCKGCCECFADIICCPCEMCC